MVDPILQKKWLYNDCFCDFTVMVVNITLTSDADDNTVDEDAEFVTITASAIRPDGMEIQGDFNVTLILTDVTAGKPQCCGKRDNTTYNK